MSVLVGRLSPTSNRVGVCGVDPQHDQPTRTGRPPGSCMAPVHACLPFLKQQHCPGIQRSPPAGADIDRVVERLDNPKVTLGLFTVFNIAEALKKPDN